MREIVEEVMRSKKNKRIPDFMPILCAAIVACLLLAGMVISTFVYCAFFFAVLSVGFLVFFGATEKHAFGFLLFLFPFARMADIDASALHSYIELLTCAFVFVKFYRKKDFNEKFFVFVWLVLTNFALQVINLNASRAITTVIFTAKNFALLYMFSKAYKKEDSSFLVTSFILGFLLSIAMSLLKWEIPKFGALCGDWNEFEIGGQLVYRFSGINSDPNFFAIQLLLCFNICMIMVFNPKCNNRLVWLLATILFFVIGMYTYSKSYYLMVAVLTVFIAVFANKRRISKKFIIAFFVCVLLFFVLLIINPFNLFEGIYVRFTTEDFSTGRFAIWENYLNEIISSTREILFGLGIDAPLVGEKASHNMYIETLYYMGIVGALFFVATYLFIILSHKRKIKRGLINLVCFMSILVQHFFLNGCISYELPYYFMIACIVFNTDMGNKELIVNNAKISVDGFIGRIIKSLFKKKSKVETGTNQTSEIKEIDITNETKDN